MSQGYANISLLRIYLMASDLSNYGFCLYFSCMDDGLYYLLSSLLSSLLFTFFFFLSEISHKFIILFLNLHMVTCPPLFTYKNSHFTNIIRILGMLVD
jgi:hypothetical protein